MRIGAVDLERDVLVVAEIGNNHEGRLDVARELVLRAAEAGAGAVKFQTLKARLLVRPTDTARLAQLEAFELSHDDFHELAELAHASGLLFLSTPFDLGSAAFLGTFADALKVASGDNDFPALLEAVAATGKPVVLPAGMTDLEGIRRSKAIVEHAWAKLGIEQELAVLQCVSAYPTPPERANLAVIPLLAAELGCTVGYSDHTVGVEACVVATTLGARILEKHFTLDHDFSSYRDHRLSAEPVELRELVRRVEETRRLLGRPEKVVQEEELPVAAAARRSIVAAADLPRGHTLRMENLTWLRPRDGLAPGDEPKLLERRLKRDVSFGEPILLSDVE